MSLLTAKTELLEIAYLDEGPSDGPVVFLLHGWPDDVRGWQKVAPILHQAGLRTITPYLRGFGPTHFLAASSTRDGRGFALAQDVIDLADVLQISGFYVAGHDWGGRAAYLLAALFPQRVKSLAVMALTFQPHGEFTVPPFPQARQFWYQWFMCVDAGAAAVKKDPIGFAKIQWDTWSPAGWYEEQEFQQTAESFKNPDWTAITLNGYRSRYTNREVTDPRYDYLQHKMLSIEKLDQPALVIIGAADGCDDPASFDNVQEYFTGSFHRVVLDGVGHFQPREAPEAVAAALIERFK